MSLNFVNYINTVNNLNTSSIYIKGNAMNIIQEERIRKYFIDAAKELIRGEGLSVVTARNVAERAGYSYATLYNYFKDIRGPYL